MSAFCGFSLVEQTFALTGMGWGSFDFRISPLSRPFLLPGCWMEEGSVRGMSLELKGRETVAEEEGPLGPGFVPACHGLLCSPRQSGCQQTFHGLARTPLHIHLGTPG